MVFIYTNFVVVVCHQINATYFFSFFFAGQGETTLQCMSGECETPLAISTLKEALKPRLMNLLLKKIEGKEEPEEDEGNKPPTEVDMKTFIETYMTEAIIRKCLNCRKNLVKVEGCNMVTCTCGAKMCYVCRQPVNSYSHFARESR